MSHHHNDEGHHHHSNEHHHHHHHSPPSSTLSLEEKLSKLLDHWVHHNDDHAENYRDWGAQAKTAQHDEVARLLEEAAQMTEKISEKFAEAADKLKSQA
ncbi:MAG: hypothetical protein PVI90_07495 [Desulfobacteraceae bacterium]|jgi:hypothetical protein